MGHTHEDVDQLFSCISRQLKHRNALTIQGKCIDSAVSICYVMQFVTDLGHAIKTSFSPQPIVVNLDSVTDVKAWMLEQTPLLHDHLKAHQFKFQRSELGECVMFYKEWSTDTFWLPQGGLAFLPSGNTIPAKQPLVLQPYYDPDNLKKLDTTLRKVSAYLKKASHGASEWWVSWMEDAKKYIEPMEPQAIEGD